MVIVKGECKSSPFFITAVGDIIIDSYSYLTGVTLEGLFIWMIVDIFRIPGMVRGYNRDVATDVLRDLKIIPA